MPPPERPCGRTPPAPKCSSWASEVTKHELLVAGAQLDRADHLVAVLERDHLPVVAVAEHLGVDPLDDALPGAERQAGAVGGAAWSGASTRSPGSSDEELADRRAALQVRVRWPVPGSVGQVEHAEPDQPAARW